MNELVVGSFSPAEDRGNRVATRHIFIQLHAKNRMQAVIAE